MEQQQTETSLLKKAWQTHGKFTKYASGMGLIVTCCILPMSAVKAVSKNADANIIDVAGSFTAQRLTQPPKTSLQAGALYYPIYSEASPI